MSDLCSASSYCSPMFLYYRLARRCDLRASGDQNNKSDAVDQWSFVNENIQDRQDRARRTSRFELCCTFDLATDEWSSLSTIPVFDTADWSYASNYVFDLDVEADDRISGIASCSEFPAASTSCRTGIARLRSCKSGQCERESIGHEELYFLHSKTSHRECIGFCSRTQFDQITTKSAILMASAS